MRFLENSIGEELEELISIWIEKDCVFTTHIVGESEWVCGFTVLRRSIVRMQKMLVKPLF